MLSLLTNTSAMSALSLLTRTQSDLRAAMGQVSTGLRIASPSDNAAYWSIGVAMRARSSAVSAISESLDLTDSLLQVTSKALEAILGAMSGIRDDVLQARQPGVDRAALQSDVKARRQAMMAAAGDASFNGINLLEGDAVEGESTAETITQDNGVLVSGSGTDTYVLRVKGQDHRVEDAYVYDASGTRVYAPVQQPGYDPISILKAPASLGGSGVDTFGIDLDALNMLDYHRFQFDYDDHPANVVTSSVTDVSDPSRSGVFTRRDYSNLGRSGAVPWEDRGLDLFERATSLHPFQGTAAEVAGGAYVAAPRLADSPGDYFVSSRVPLEPVAGQTVTVRPFASISDLSVADRTIVYADGTPFQAYALSDQDLGSMSDLLESDLRRVVSALATVGSYVDLVANQKEFSAKLQDALAAGIGSLTDADMSVASTRLHALQAQQQLGLQSLSIANQGGQVVLKLFEAA